MLYLLRYIYYVIPCKIPFGVLFNQLPFFISVSWLLRILAFYLCSDYYPCYILYLTYQRYINFCAYVYVCITLQNVPNSPQTFFPFCITSTVAVLSVFFFGVTLLHESIKIFTFQIHLMLQTIPSVYG